MALDEPCQFVGTFRDERPDLALRVHELDDGGTKHREDNDSPKESHSDTTSRKGPG